MMRGLLIICCCVFAVSCGKKEDKPRDLIPEKKMQAVLRDMMRADQFLSDYVLSRDTSRNKRTESIKLYRQVLALHQVTKEAFRHSFHYYEQRPAGLKSLLDSIGAARISVPGVLDADTASGTKKEIKRPD